MQQRNVSLGWPLTWRERQVVAAKINGMTGKEIGRELNISYRTVQLHLYRAKIKLGATTKTQLVAAAHLAGIIDFDEMRALRE